MKTNQRGIALIIEFEGFRPDAYLCPAGVVTIGFGFTKGVQMGDRMTRSEAAERLKRELAEYEQGVLAACTLPPNENEFSAFVSFAFNVGVAGFRSSSVLKAHNRGDKQAAARAFQLWNKATVGGVKKTLPGLTRRRMAEAALYLAPVAIDEVQMPQRIEPETPMTASPINRASVVAGGTATVAAVSETIQTINGVKYGVEGLGDWLVPLLLVAVVGLCAYIVWERVKVRQQGWS
jgi:lysozyme